MADIKKTTEYKVTPSFCQCCQCYRYFYSHRDGGMWFCQICGWVNCNLNEVSNELEAD